MNETVINHITMEDMLASGCCQFSNIIAVIEKALLDAKAGRIPHFSKSSYIQNESTQDRVNCMPAALPDAGVCGVKWVSVFPSNAGDGLHPNVCGVILLSELRHGQPLAVLDGSLITAMRTACVGAIAAKHLARANSRTYGSIGSGEQAQMHFAAFKYVLPELKTCQVASRTEAGEAAFVRRLSKRYPDVTFVPCHGDCDAAAAGADVVTTAVSCQAPLLRAQALKRGAFYCHVGGWEDEYAVAQKADKIVCDCWQAVKHRTQTISRMYREGLLRDADIHADLADILDGSRPARQTEEETIYFNSVGLAFIDVAVAHFIYQAVTAKGLGRPWTMAQSAAHAWIERSMDAL